MRDRTCFHPFCDEVPERPEVDHIHEAGKGGATTQANGRLGCGFHNRWRNQHPDDWHDPGERQRGASRLRILFDEIAADPTCILSG